MCEVVGCSALSEAESQEGIMPTVDERFRQVTLKIKRAKEHVADLDVQLRAFFDTRPYRVATKRNPQTRHLIYYVSCAHPIPESIHLSGGDP